MVNVNIFLCYYICYVILLNIYVCVLNIFYVISLKCYCVGKIWNQSEKYICTHWSTKKKNIYIYIYIRMRIGNFCSRLSFYPKIDSIL